MLTKGTKVRFLGNGGYTWFIPRWMCYGIVQLERLFIIQVRTYLKILNIPVCAILGDPPRYDWFFYKEEITEI